MLLSDDDAALLGVPPGSPVLYIQRIAYLADGRGVEFTRSYYRSDTYEFVSEVTPARTQQERAHDPDGAGNRRERRGGGSGACARTPTAFAALGAAMRARSIPPSSSPMRAAAPTIARSISNI